MNEIAPGFREGLLTKSPALKMAERQPVEPAHLDKPKEDRRTFSPQNGMLSLDGVRYTLGAEYGNKPIRVETISHDLAGILEERQNGSATLVGTFKRFSRGDRSLKERVTRTGKFWDAGKSLIEPQEFDEQTFKKREEGESVEEYRDRLKEMDAYSSFLKLRNDLAGNTGFRFTELSPESQEVLKNDPSWYKKNRAELLKTARELGQTGFEIAALLSDDPLAERKAVDALKRVPEEEREESLQEFFDVTRERTAVHFITQSAIDIGTLELHETPKLNEVINASLQKAIGALSLLPVERETILNQEKNKMELALAELLSKSFKSAEEARHFISLISQTKDPSTKEMAGKILELLNPAASEVIHDDLRTLYDKIKFQEYKVNEAMQATDAEVLTDTLRGHNAHSVIDLGAGTGRLTKVARDEGMNVTAVDFMPRHAEIIRHDVPEAKVLIADWVKTPLPEEQTDMVYILGRSILHEYVPDRQRALFTEVYRLLKPGGTFLFDVPDKTRGVYATLTKQYANAMKSRGLPYREGTIYDSPDGQNFFTRYVFSEEDIRKLADETGFAVEKVENHELKNDKGDTNKYFTLRKLSPAEEQMAIAAK